MSRPPFGDPGVCPTIALFSSTTNHSPFGGLFSTAWIRFKAWPNTACFTQLVMELWLTPRSRSVARWPTPSRYCAKAAAFVSGGTKRRSLSPKVLWQTWQRQRWWPWREVPFLTQWVAWQWGQFMPNPTTLQPAYQYLFSNPRMRERLEMVGGRFEIESAPGRGTTVTAEMPLGKVAKIAEAVC